MLNARGVTLATTRAEIVRVLGETRKETARLLADRQGSLKAMSYTVEIEYDDWITVRKQCTSRDEALNFLVTN